MSNVNVTKFEPANYVDKIRDRMKQTMVDAVPDEQWDAMIKAELEGFFKERFERPHYGGETKRLPSLFQQAIQRRARRGVQKSPS